MTISQKVRRETKELFKQLAFKIRNRHRLLIAQLCDAVRLEERALNCHVRARAIPHTNKIRQIKDELASIINCPY